MNLEETLFCINEDYETIRIEYSDSEQLKEITRFLDLAFPEWKTNKGLGEGAPEYVLRILEHTEEAYHENSMLEYLIFLYTEVEDTYDRAKEFFIGVFEEECSNHFFYLDDDLFYDEYGIESDDVTDEQLGKIYDSYFKKRVNQKPFNFDFDESKNYIMIQYGLY